MANPIDFYFDFSSPYGYFASEKIDELAAKHGRQIAGARHDAARAAQQSVGHQGAGADEERE